MLFVGSFPQAFLFVGLPCCNGTDRGKGDEGRGGAEICDASPSCVPVWSGMSLSKISGLSPCGILSTVVVEL